MSYVPKALEDKSANSVAGLRFLVVDDHKFSRHICVEALKWLSATKIAEAADANEAIGMLRGVAAFDRKAIASKALAKHPGQGDNRRFDQGTFDCVITDFNMRPLNGLHLLKAIRTGEAKCDRDTPVLMLTGFSDDYLIASALSLDINAFLLKPISRVTFSEKLRRVLVHPINPRSAEAYEAVDVPDCDDLTNLQSEATPKGSDSKKKPEPEPMMDFGSRPVETVMLADILENDRNGERRLLGEDLVLGADVLGPHGAVYLNRGTKLTTQLLDKLHELQGIGMMPDQLKVIR